MEWTTYQLSDVCTIKKRGVTPKEGVCYALYSLPAFDKSKKPEIVYGQEIKSNKFSIQNNTILFNKLNVRFKRVWNIKELKHSNNICSTEFFPLSVKGDVEQDFLYYYLISDHITEILKKSLSGTSSSHQRIDLNLFLQLPINLPSISDQRKIAGILSALDAKIENNNKINANLEAQAEALFKSWFVDFTPFKDQPFVDSELGPIPQGWKVGKLTDIAVYLNGLAMQKFPPQDIKDSFPVLKIKELGAGICDNSSDRCSNKVPKKYIIEDGDIIFSWSGTLMVDVWCGGQCGLNQHLFKVSSSNYPKWFYYHWTKKHLRDFIHIARDKAVTMGHIKRGHLDNALVVVPNNFILEKATHLFEPLLNMVISKRIENQRLAALRDTLLPKLMSGEIKL